MAYHRCHGMPVRIARILNTYGPRMRTKDGRAVPNFITQALAGKPITVYGDGSQTRSLTYVDDLVAGIDRLVASKQTGPINIGNPREMTLLEIAKIIKKLTKSRSRIVFKPLPIDDPKVRRPDITLARAKLKWEPKVPLEEGLKRTIAYFRRTLCAPRSPSSSPAATKKEISRATPPSFSRPLTRSARITRS